VTNFDQTFCSNDDCTLRKECERSLSNLKINKREWLSVSYFEQDAEGFCAFLIKKDEGTTSK
jgi:hypothetical protein